MLTTPVSALQLVAVSVEETDGGTSGTYGITTSGNQLSLKFVTQGPYSKNIGSRVYLMSQDDTTYEMFNLKNQEFTFDVDVSNLPCGLNGAVYFAEVLLSILLPPSGADHLLRRWKPTAACPSTLATRLARSTELGIATPSARTTSSSSTAR